jgi:hypothetical protein
MRGGEEHVTYMGEIRNECKILAGNLKRRDHSQHPGVERRIILKRMLGK